MTFDLETASGAPAIAQMTGVSVRRAQYLLETGRLPAYKIGSIWHLRKSTYLAFVEKLEAKFFEEVEAREAAATTRALDLAQDQNRRRPGRPASKRAA